MLHTTHTHPIAIPFIISHSSRSFLPFSSSSPSQKHCHPNEEESDLLHIPRQPACRTHPGVRGRESHDKGQSPAWQIRVDRHPTSTQRRSTDRGTAPHTHMRHRPTHIHLCTVTSCSPADRASYLRVNQYNMRKKASHAPYDTHCWTPSYMLLKLFNISLSSPLHIRYLSRLTLTAFFRYQHQTKEQAKQRRSQSLLTRADSLKRRSSAW